MSTAVATRSDPLAAQAAASQARERRLFLRWQRFGDEAARDELVERFLPLARHLARRFGRGPDGLDDLTQVASIGLLKAIDRFDPGRGFAFSTFAVPTITGELKRYARDFGWAVHLPRALRERAVRLRRTEGRLAGELGRSPAIDELAAACDLTVEQTREAIEAAASAEPSSLDAGGRGDPEGDTPANGPADEDGGYERVDYVDAVSRRVGACSERDRLELRLRLVDGLSQREIGRRIGLSQMQVSRILRNLMAA